MAAHTGPDDLWLGYYAATRERFNERQTTIAHQRKVDCGWR